MQMREQQSIWVRQIRDRSYIRTARSNSSSDRSLTPSTTERLYQGRSSEHEQFSQIDEMSGVEQSPWLSEEVQVRIQVPAVVEEVLGTLPPVLRGALGAAAVITAECYPARASLLPRLGK